MRSNLNYTATQLLLFGLALALLKAIYLFLDFYNILDLVVFLSAGFVLGERIPSNRFAIGLLLSLPAFILCLLFVVNLGYSQIVDGVGTSFAVSLILIPLSTAIGIFAKHASKRYLRRGDI